MTKRRPFLGIFAAMALVMGMAVSAVAPPAAAADPIQLAPNGAPASIPGLSNWTAGTGSFQYSTGTRVIAGAGAEAEAATLATDLTAALGTDVAVTAGSPAAGDVVLTLDAAATDLGAEGYRIEVGETIEVTAANEAGLFYGGQTATQWATLAGTASTIPAGSSTDVPAYPVRSLGICACIVNISMERFEQVIEEMAYYKVNELWLEMKVESEAYPQATFWSYYSNEQVDHLKQMAAEHHITLVPEVNSPGHMGPWLQNLPELQLQKPDGTRAPKALDISKPEALEVVTTLAAEYIEKFDSGHYHMGADEYLLGSGRWSDFPQLKAEAVRKFGSDANEYDLFIDFINQVNDFVKERGTTLHIWNDGIGQGNVNTLDEDIIVEFWDNAGRSLEDTLAAGNDVVNTDQRLYFTRNNNWGTAEARWDEGWTPTRYIGRDISDADTDGDILGGKMVLWPDNGPGKTENQMFSEIPDTLRYLAQATWSTVRPTETYAQFKALGDTLGAGPRSVVIDRAPLMAGQYGIESDGTFLTAGNPATMSETDGVWNFTPTADGYYKIAQGDQCLAMARGDDLNLSSPNDFGQTPIMTTCTTDREAGNLQKWWVRQVAGGFTISHAISNMPLVVNGAEVAQQDPNHNEASVFLIKGDGVATSVGSLGRLLAGETTTITVDVRNLGSELAKDVVVTPAAPEGWILQPTSREVGEIAGFASQQVTFELTPNAGPAGEMVLDFLTTWTEGDTQRERSVSVPVAMSCAAGVTSPSEVVRVSSEQDDTAERAPAVNIIDGNPNTFWHTQWNAVEPTHPHQVVVGLEAEAEVCAVTLTPRQGASSGAVNGQIKDYEIYATSDADVAADTTGTPGSAPEGWTLVAEGTLPTGQSAQWIPLNEVVSAQYLLLVAKSAQNPDHPWTTLGEFSVDLVAEDTTAPVVVAEDLTAVQGESVSAQVQAADASAVTFEATGLPAGLTMSASGLISGTATAAPGEYRVTVTVTDVGGLSTTVEFTVTVVEPQPEPTQEPTQEPTDDPTTPPVKKYVRTAPYTLPGLHKGLNGRDWNTKCEPYSQTERCRTDIWATIVVIEDGQFVRKDGWTFNNLTYLPFMTREAWGANPLANKGEWTATTDQRKWMTECDTERTGRNGCRSYAFVTVYRATAKPEGGYVFSQNNEWVFNNIVMFGGPELR